MTKIDLREIVRSQSELFRAKTVLSEGDVAVIVKNVFGTDGIRGKAGVYPLNAEGATQIGKAVGTYFAQPGDTILVGHDPRESSPALVASVIAGLTAVGVHTTILGVIPTPGLAYLTKHQDAVAGIMITASHNAYTDNGIKVFTNNGDKLSDDIQTSLNTLIASDIDNRADGTVAEDHALTRSYADFLVSSANGQLSHELNIAIDCANGATSLLANDIFQKLGIQTIPLFNKPNGTNINAKCGATDTTALREVVKTQHLSGGIAFDGDGDRVVLVDEQARELSGDHILYILALTGGHKGVVATMMSNMGLDTTLKAHGVALHRTAVGDRYVLEGLAQTGFTLGGEQSGHIILPELSTTGDGMLAAIQTLQNVTNSGKSLAQWYDELQLLPQALINIPVSDKSLLDRLDIQEYIDAQIAELGEGGRINIRPSGTEPKVRVMVESSDATERAQTIADTLSKLIENQ